LTDTLSRVITSCFGTLSTMTRRSTFFTLWMTGQIRIIPGPFTPVKRPRVNITTRSYSFSTFMALNTSMAMMTTMTTRAYGMRISPEAGRLL
jgi:hypothetical protein